MPKSLPDQEGLDNRCKWLGDAPVFDYIACQWARSRYRVLALAVIDHAGYCWAWFVAGIV